jgi:putative ABC transport system substrate-binding protein
LFCYRCPRFAQHSRPPRENPEGDCPHNQGGLFPRAAPYVDRILRGAKPGDFPVQLPTKFEMVPNLKTAKALGLTVPPSIRLRATEVIQ